MGNGKNNEHGERLIANYLRKLALSLFWEERLIGEAESKAM